jgi:hypothetical protein
MRLGGRKGASKEKRRDREEKTITNVGDSPGL